MLFKLKYKYFWKQKEALAERERGRERDSDLQQRGEVLYVEGVQQPRAALVGGAATQLHLHVDRVDDGQRRLLLAAKATGEHLERAVTSHT